MMAAYQEDVQSVLEQFVENVANLPAELAHLFEEMQAKDKRMAELREVIATKDTSIQRFIKQNGSNVPYAKESSYTKIITDSYAEVSRIQTEKCALASKAMDLMTRHIKRLDLKIKDLQTDGLLPNEPLVTPTFLATLQAPALVPTGSSKTNNSNPNGPNSNSRLPPHASTGNTPSNGTTTPTGATIRDHVATSISAAGNDPKRRRLPGGSISLPAAPSPLNTSITPSALNLPLNRDSLPARTAHTGRKAPPPKGAHRRSGLNKRKDRDEEEDDDVDDSEDDEEEEEAGEDHRPYCTCRQVSYGDMVACDDPTCPFEWFHWSCVGLQREPVGKWFCDHCSAKRNGKLPKRDGSVS